MSSSRRSPFRVPLCPSLELRYSISVIAAPKEKYACGYFNSARYYFYCPAAKKSIGKAWQTTYTFTKKEIKAAKGTKPTVYEPKETDIQEALENLLNQNTNLPDYAVKKAKQVQLNTDELLVFWLTHSDAIAGAMPSTPSAYKLNKKMAKVLLNPRIASFDLSSLLSIQKDLLESACRSLVAQVKKTVTGRESGLTKGVEQTVHLIRYAVQIYFNGKNSDPSQALYYLKRESRTKPGPVSKTTNAMRLKSIPIGRYRELWGKLTASKQTDSDYAENTALLVMLFLGLTSEEVCGLQSEDFRQIPDRPGFHQLRIIHKYSNEQAKKYSLEVLDEEHACRNIPLPFQIRKQVECFTKKRPDSSTYLFEDGNKPLNPKKLDQKLKELLKTPANNLSIKTNHEKKKEVDVSFHAKSYRESCRFYWQYHCGLTKGEICYLSALAPPDTAAGHYIDFNNGSVQYLMLKQIEYGIALFASQDRHYKPHREWSAAPNRFYSSGQLEKRASMDIRITEPVELKIASNRGIMIYLEEDEEQT